MQYYTNTQYVDLETGEQIEEEIYLKQYTTITQKKYATVNTTRTKCTINITKCGTKHAEQLELFNGTTPHRTN